MSIRCSCRQSSLLSFFLFQLDPLLVLYVLTLFILLNFRFFALSTFLSLFVLSFCPVPLYPTCRHSSDLTRYLYCGFYVKVAICLIIIYILFIFPYPRWQKKGEDLNLCPFLFLHSPSISFLVYAIAVCFIFRASSGVIR